MLPKWRQEQRELGLSRKKWLSALIPVAGDRDEKRKVIEEGRKVAGIHNFIGQPCKENRAGMVFWVDLVFSEHVMEFPPPHGRNYF